MSYGQLHSPGADDWFEQIRDFLNHEPPVVDEAVLEAAYEASEIDTAAMFDYFEGRLSAEDRRELEAEAARSPHALRKLARIGAIVARTQGRPKPARAAASPMRSRLSAQPTASAAVSSPAASASKSRALGGVKLSPPQPSAGKAAARPEDIVRVPTDPDCELSRSLDRGRDQLRIYHRRLPLGTLLGVRVFGADAKADDLSETRFAVLRRASETTTAAIVTVPAGFEAQAVDVELFDIPLGELTARDAAEILRSYERAAGEDPIAVTPLHEPRSAWQIWAGAVLSTPAERVPPAVWEVAELIAIA